MAVTDKSQNSETKNPPVVRQKGFFVWVNIGVPGIEPGSKQATKRLSTRLFPD